MLVGTAGINLYRYLYAFIVGMFQTINGSLVSGGISMTGEYIGNVYENIDYVAQKLGYFRFLSVSSVY
jgi:hypothetical protein